METLLQNDRIRVLLREADEAARMMDRLGDGPQGADVREALAGIHRDLGAAVHAEWRALMAPPLDRSPPPVARSRADDDDFDFRHNSQESTAESLEVDPHTDVPETPPVEVQGDAEDLERWYTDEVEIEHREPLFSPGDLDSPGEAGASGDGDAPPGLPDASDLPADANVAWLEGANVARPEADAAWVVGARELVALIGPPPAAGVELADEASRVQWAASAIESRWAGFPSDLRTALIGMLAARSRHLQASLEVDVGPRMALDRLRKARRAASLPEVTGLMPDRGPEQADWREDAVGWWQRLAAALDETPGNG